MLRLPRRTVTTAVLMILCAPAVTSWADAPVGEVTVAHARSHDDDGDHPRLKLSYRHFAITNLDGSQIPLDGAQLDAYLVSRRWLRIGLELEGGGGSGSYSGYQANLDYGLVGLAAGVQIPGPITPFVEGRVIGGFLAGQVTGTPAAASDSGFMLTMDSATTYIYGGGVDVGMEIYSIGRSYVSLSVGWVWTTWHGIDQPATTADTTGAIHYKDIAGNSVTLKVGIGI